MTSLVILDYGMGNLRSVAKALEHVGARVAVTADHREIGAADGVVLPGVGAYPRAMAAVRARGLDHVLADRVAAGVPALGLCLGMQLLFEGSTELGGAEGLGLVRGRVEALEAPGLKVPHIGWNPVRWHRPSLLGNGLPAPCAFYHANSFAARPGEPDDVVGSVEYGTEFVSVVERGPVLGVQFHPEKSGPHGLALLANFVSACSGRRQERAGPAPAGARA